MAVSDAYAISLLFPTNITEPDFEANDKGVSIYLDAKSISLPDKVPKIIGEIIMTALQVSIYLSTLVSGSTICDISNEYKSMILYSLVRCSVRIFITG